MPKSTVCEGCCETLSSVHCGAKQYYFFFCNKCKKKTSIRRKTILSFASISFRKLILLIYTFVACLWTYKQVKTEVSVSSSDDNSDDDSSSSSSFLSNKTISRFYTVFRYILSYDIVRDSIFIIYFILFKNNHSTINTFFCIMHNCWYLIISIIIFRDIIGEEMLTQNYSNKIGGPGLTVEVCFYFYLYKLRLSCVTLYLCT